MYTYGGACCPNQANSYIYPTGGYSNHYAIVLVLFILLVIIIGSRTMN